VAVRGNRKRAFWCAVVGGGLLLGGILAFFGARVQYDHRIIERVQAEADAAQVGRPAPAGPDATLLRKERRIIPWLLHIFTFAGLVMISIGIAELRGWRVLDPTTEQPPPPKLP